MPPSAFIMAKVRGRRSKDPNRSKSPGHAERGNVQHDQRRSGPVKRGRAFLFRTLASPFHDLSDGAQHRLLGSFWARRCNLIFDFGSRAFDGDFLDGRGSDTGPLFKFRLIEINATVLPPPPVWSMAGGSQLNRAAL